METVSKGIVILTTGRAGSSMVAGIFAKHGLWCGEQRKEPVQFNAKGFFENEELHKLMKKLHGREIEAPILSEIHPDWLKRAEKIMISQSVTDPWFFKTGAWYHKCWEPFTDRIVKIHRPFEKVMESYRKCGFLPFGRYDVEHILAQQIDYMESLPGVYVNTEELVQGDISSLEDAFDYCGLNFDRKIAEAFIDPNLYSL